MDGMMPAEAGSGPSVVRANTRRTTCLMDMSQLSALPREELVSRWEAIYGSPPPPGIKRPLLERAIAWHLQAKMFGGLSPKTLRELRAALLPIGPKSQGIGIEEAASPIRRAPSAKAVRAGAVPVKAGARLVREWQGRTHVVDVTPGGYTWKGETYRSLSAVARKITGARWSGPRFFGL